MWTRTFALATLTAVLIAGLAATGPPATQAVGTGPELARTKPPDPPKPDDKKPKPKLQPRHA